MSVFRAMVDFIKSAELARKYIVPCLDGPPGIGKTAACKQAAVELAEEGRATGRVVTIIASQILPNEVSGITMPVVESKAMEIFDHFRLSSLKDGDILFFDELLEADQLVLSACLTLIESRELMSGRKLPDCMIVAATNPSIKPNMLKENIRQRFVWREFTLDTDGCRDYILNTCGFDVGQEVLSKLCCTGEEYNILTPRSLTKMAQWISEADDENSLRSISKQINLIWKSSLGTALANAYMKKLNNPTSQVRRAIANALNESNIDIFTDILGDDEAFEASSIVEVMETLKQLPEWPEISKRLAEIEIEDPDNGIVEF